MSNPRATLGRSGEAHALAYMEAHGHTLIARNWHCRQGEFDLIMHDGSCLVFVEVKARRGDAAGRAEDAITRNKSRKLLSAAMIYLQQHPELQEAIWRIDLIAIDIDPMTGEADLRHYENAVVIG